MNLNTIKAVFERKLADLGITAEITFINSGMFSIFVELSPAYDLALKVLSAVPNIKFESEEIDEQLGCFAYYTF